MNCPKCHQHVDDDLSFCTHCGEPVKSGLNIDADLVFSEKEAPPTDQRNGAKIVLIIIAVLIVCVGAVAVFVVMRQNDHTSSAQAQTTTTQETSGAATGAATESGNADIKTIEVPTIAPPETFVPETTIPETTVQPTTAAPTLEARLEDYARSSGMVEILRQAADANTTISVKGEENALRARYRVNLDSTAGENNEYFETLPDAYDALCAQLDGTVYDMNQQDGISNAVLEIYVFDNSGRQVYRNTVD